jgi:hypothetical protein
MALHAPLTHFLARLNTDLGAGTGGEFLAATGRRLVAGHVLPEEEFSRTAGTPGDGAAPTGPPLQRRCLGFTDHFKPRNVSMNSDRLSIYPR